MKSLFFLMGVLIALCPALAQELPHRMRVGISLDLVGNTLGVGSQLHASFRMSGNERTFTDVHKYLNAGAGIGASLSSALSVGASVPHYLTFGIGRRRAMWEFGLAGVRRQKLITGLYNDPQTGELRQNPSHQWRYTLLPIVGYRYTAYSGFLFRVNGPVPGIAFGWVF